MKRDSWEKGQQGKVKNIGSYVIKKSQPHIWFVRNLSIMRGMIIGCRNEREWLRDLGGHMLCNIYRVYKRKSMRNQSGVWEQNENIFQFVWTPE